VIFRSRKGDSRRVEGSSARIREGAVGRGPITGLQGMRPRWPTSRGGATLREIRAQAGGICFRTPSHAAQAAVLVPDEKSNGAAQPRQAGPPWGAEAVHPQASRSAITAGPGEERRDRRTILAGASVNRTSFATVRRRTNFKPKSSGVPHSRFCRARNRRAEPEDLHRRNGGIARHSWARLGVARVSYTKT